jgi:hypothetical protein
MVRIQSLFLLDVRKRGNDLTHGTHGFVDVPGVRERPLAH